MRREEVKIRNGRYIWYGSTKTNRISSKSFGAVFLFASTQSVHEVCYNGDKNSETHSRRKAGGFSDRSDLHVRMQVSYRNDLRTNNRVGYMACMQIRYGVGRNFDLGVIRPNKGRYEYFAI